MKLSEWAKKQGISYRTAWNWFKAGSLPVEAIQTASGTILVVDSQQENHATAVLYARVSSADQKHDLDRQIARLIVFANAHGLIITQTITEIGSALNGRRPRLKRLLADPKVKIIVVEHRDRLMRFGTEYVESALGAMGRKLVIAERTELKDD